MSPWKVVPFFILSLVLIPIVDPANILFLFPLSCRSELNAIHLLATQLLSRGHQITWVTSVKTSIQHQNYTEIVPITIPTRVIDYQGTATSTILDHRSRYNKLLPFFLKWNLDSQTRRCNAIYRHPGFQKEVLSSSNSFDMVFINGNLHHCLLGVIPTLELESQRPLPFIVFTSTPFTGEEFRFPGFRMPSSFVPSSSLGLTGVMTFPQRLLNFTIRMAFSLFGLNYIESGAEEIYKSHLITNNSTNFPAISQIAKNAALVFSNSHPAITNPRPVTPDIVEVGCLQCRKKMNPLPLKLDKWMQDAGHEGIILFSMGSMFSISSFPPHLQTAVMNVFSRLKQRVILVADENALGNMTTPKNILVTPWVPQQDVLGDNRLKLFISHGGTQSHLEASWHGVPVLYLPIWADQALAAAHVVENGNGVALEILELTEESFETAIKSVLNDIKYKNRATELSAIFRDQPETALQRAVFWTEYVIRHKGAKQLKTAARGLNPIQYYCLDILLFIMGCFMFVGWLIVYIHSFVKSMKHNFNLGLIALHSIMFAILWKLISAYFIN